MILDRDFYRRDCETVAKALVGKLLVHDTPQGRQCLRISQTEVYCGVEDTACHAHRGRTERTEVMYGKAGTAYIYLCYGIHWLLNIVTGEEGHPEAVLIRACLDAPGPGKLTKHLGITGALNRADVCGGSKLWVEDDGFSCTVTAGKRIGIGYASQEDQDRLWRFILHSERRHL